jgi:hypothetical protein
MVTHHDMGESSHNREEESDERRVVETPRYLAKTVRSLMEELQSFKVDNERLIKEQEKKIEINAILLQIMSDIQRQLQHGPTANNVDRHQSKKTHSPPEIQKHGPKNSNTRRSTSKKAQHGAKRHANVKDSSEEYSSEGADNSKELSSSETSSHSQRRRNRRKHSKSHDPQEFKKYKPPTFDGEIKKGEEVEVWLFVLKKYFRVHDYSENLKA